MKIKQIKKMQVNGFTLIEAMIAVVVFSFGLLGVAGVMAVSVRSNHNGYMRTQATFLATSMADMMRTNDSAVKDGVYNASVNGHNDLGGSCSSSDCNSSQMAARDLQMWSNMITQILPNSSGSVACTAHTGNIVHPYSGLCTIEVNWTESNEIDSDSLQSITLIAKPLGD